ncbi:acyl carrier protein [Vallitalea guaymasensis]|uniref:acyl carrier protein n=1 Tax=Vallitalea guaymasensis TaxID=1185412 RepID=UPI000DE457C5|nr:acyl carrier protein [Vallitalea guaymasensis]
MIHAIKKILGEFSGMDYKLVTNDMHLKDDLYLDDSDLDDVLNEIEDLFGFEFNDRDAELVYVSDLIAFVKATI